MLQTKAIFKTALMYLKVTLLIMIPYAVFLTCIGMNLTSICLLITFPIVCTFGITIPALYQYYLLILDELRNDDGGTEVLDPPIFDPSPTYTDNNSDDKSPTFTSNPSYTLKRGFS